jgi:hypothetical protein
MAGAAADWFVFAAKLPLPDWLMEAVRQKRLCAEQ